ncbi:MAG: DUF1501 domain-containing protein [Myxococcales bacterium]|nr:DUF1501 domain-containing protein [Myxococcales bacterium]
MRRRSFLAGAAAVPALGTLALAASQSSKRLVVVFANGGWDTSLALDPKLGNPAIEGPEVDQDPDDPEDVDALATIAGIPLVINDRKRPAVTRFFERWGRHTVLVNGIWVGSIAHDPCRWRMLSGRVDGRGPDVTAMAGASLGADLPLGAVDTSGLGLAGPLAASVGRVGARSQLEMLLEPARSPRAASGGPSPAFVARSEERAWMREFLEARDEQGRERFGAKGAVAYDALSEARLRSDRLVAQRDSLVQGLSMGQEPKLSGLVDTVVDLLAADACRAVLVDSGRSWDTHEANVNQHGHYDILFDDLDQLVTGLDIASLLSSTVVVVLSEMARTPKRNGALGKDHWPHTSALLLGGDVRGGRVCGGTDALAESLPMDLSTGALDAAGQLLKYDNLVAGLLTLLDVDPSPWLPGTVPFTGATA